MAPSSKNFDTSRWGRIQGPFPLNPLVFLLLFKSGIPHQLWSELYHLDLHPAQDPPMQDCD